MKWRPVKGIQLESAGGGRYEKKFFYPSNFHGDDDDEMSHLNGHALNEIKMNEKKDKQKRSLNCEK